MSGAFITEPFVKQRVINVLNSCTSLIGHAADEGLILTAREYFNGTINQLYLIIFTGNLYASLIFLMRII